MDDIKLLTQLVEGPIPEYKTLGAAGIDLHAAHSVTMQPWRLCQQPFRIGLGVAFHIPEGHFGLIHGRSGLATAGLLAHTGVIDCDYRGEVGVILFNFGQNSMHVEKGDRIAQLVILPYARTTIVCVPTLEESARGKGGFGSTGK